MIYLPGVLALGTGILCWHLFCSRIDKKRAQNFQASDGILDNRTDDRAYCVIAIVMGPATLDMPKAPLSAASFDMAAFLLGIAIPAGLEFARYKIKRIKDRSEIENAPSPSESEESQKRKM